MVIKIDPGRVCGICSVILIICTLCSALIPHLKAEEEIPLPVIMYHHISGDENALNDYVISPEEFEGDIVYLKEKGYEFILPREIIEFQKGKRKLPKKPVMITFDDGFESVYHYAFPLCEKYGLKFTLAILGHETEFYSERDEHNILYSYITLEEITELEKSGAVEIANHTFGLHEIKGRKGVTRNRGESKEEFRKNVGGDIARLQEYLSETGITPRTFVYPYGFYCKDSMALIKELGFEVSFICTEGINYITAEPECLYNLKRYNRPSGIKSDDFFIKKGIIKNAEC